MGILQTIIRSEGSNALKFSITADDAVASLLAPGRPGYMDPLAAAQEAVEDIKLHELAVIVGMRNALEALLRRFDPTALEQRMAKENLLEAVLPRPARRATGMPSAWSTGTYRARPKTISNPNSAALSRKRI